MRTWTIFSYWRRRDGDDAAVARRDGGGRCGGETEGDMDLASRCFWPMDGPMGVEGFFGKIASTVGSDLFYTGTKKLIRSNCSKASPQKKLTVFFFKKVFIRSISRRHQ
jgi:hypothetical protein